MIESDESAQVEPILLLLLLFFLLYIYDIIGF